MADAVPEFPVALWLVGLPQRVLKEKSADEALWTLTTHRAARRTRPIRFVVHARKVWVKLPDFVVRLIVGGGLQWLFTQGVCQVL